MARMHYPSVSEVADQVLREISAEEQIKTAERLILRNATRPVQSDVAQDLVKLAAQCRHIKVDDPEVSYDDLYNFMAQCNER